MPASGGRPRRPREQRPRRRGSKLQVQTSGQHMNARTSAVLGAISNFVAIMLIGMSIGWLSGLSSGSLFSVAMPVLFTLIASALAAARLIGKPAADAMQAISIYAITIFVI